MPAGVASVALLPLLGCRAVAAQAMLDNLGAPGALLGVMVDIDFSNGQTAVVDRPSIGEPRRPVGLETAELQTGSVFVTTGGLRARALRWSGYLIGTLTVLWLIALIAGALGAGRLPAVLFPSIGALRGQHGAPARRPAPPPASSRRVTAPAGLAGGGPVVLGGPAPDGLSPSGPAISAPTGTRLPPARGGGDGAPGNGVGSSAPLAANPLPTGRQPTGASTTTTTRRPTVSPAAGRASTTAPPGRAADLPTATPGSALPTAASGTARTHTGAG